MDEHIIPPDSIHEEEDATMDLLVGAIGNNKKDNKCDLWYVDIYINEVEIQFKLDTGSEANIVQKETFDKLKNIKMRPSRCRLIIYTGQHIEPIGEADIEINGYNLCFQITQSGSPILGKNACVTLNLIARIDEISTSAATENNTHELVNTYSDVFKGLGLIKANAQIHIDHNVPPIADPPCRIPHAIENDVKKELDWMERLGVIV